MNVRHIFFFIATICLLTASCKNKQDKPKQPQPNGIEQAIFAHGSHQLDSMRMRFDFRGVSFEADRDQGLYRYLKTSLTKEGDTLKEMLSNAGYTQEVNGERQMVADSTSRTLSNALNSVIYFAQLPYGLDGPAVYREYIHKDTLQDKVYDVIRVTFSEIGGGEDHDDVFYYWLAEDSGLIDYLAYSYCEADCGYRFRIAKNRRTINGVVVQDYDNYSVQVNGPELEQFFDYLEQGKLTKVSEIALDNVRVE